MGKKVNYELDRRQKIESWMRDHHMFPGFTNDLDKVAGVLRKTYVAQRAAAFPNYKLNTKRYSDDFWRTVGIKVIDGGFDPVNFILAAMAEYGPSMEANYLTGNKVVAVYGRRARNIYAQQAHLEKDLDLDIQTLACQMSLKYKSLTDILRDPTHSFNPAFVYCVALDYKLADVAAEFKRKALFRFNDKIYQKVYTKAFPKVLKGVFDVDNQ